MFFTDKELEGTEDYCERKIDDILNEKGGSDFDYIRNLQTLVSLKNTANQKIQRIKDRRKRKAPDRQGLGGRTERLLNITVRF